MILLTCPKEVTCPKAYILLKMMRDFYLIGNAVSLQVSVLDISLPVSHSHTATSFLSLPLWLQSSISRSLLASLLSFLR